MRAWGALLALSASLAGCALDPAKGLDVYADEALAGSTPYVLASEGRVTFFRCRFRTEAAIVVSLPVDADAAATAALRAALRAWEGAGLGVHFVETTPGAPASIGITFVKAGRWDEPGHQGSTLADCRVRGAETASPLDAEIVYARIGLSRSTPRDWRDRDRLLTPAELAGAAAHELGHALGFPGHASRAGSVLTRNREDVVHIGAAILRGEPLRESALRALYGLPSGAVVRRVAVSRARTEPLDRLLTLARSRGYAGPFVRSGERSARIFVVTGPAEEAGVAVTDLAALERAPERLALVADARASALLAETHGERGQD